MRRAAGIGSGLGDQAVHLFPSVATEENDDFIGLPGIRDRLADFVTKTNWEHVGVKPDIAVPAAQALQTMA